LRDGGEVVDRVLERALRVSLERRAALGLVGVEQRLAGVTGEHQGELPGEVVHVLDRAGEPEAACGRMAMRGIAREEYAPGPEALGHDGVDRPARDAVHLHREVADAQRGADVGLDLLVGLRARIVDGVVEVDHPLLGAATPVLRPHGHHHHADAALG
jgi:hypothetical protein